LRIAWGKRHSRLKNKLQAESMSFGSIVVAVAVKDGGRLDKNNKS
jgi:NAD/NADP transhydrogenase alpha subunit